MKTNNIFSYKLENTTQKIWRVCPDPKSEFVALEIREKKEQKNTSQLLILNSKEQNVFSVAEMEATQTLLHFFDKTILISEIDIQETLPISKGIQALSIDFETIWQLEEVNYYTILEEHETTKVIFSLQSDYYSVPLQPKKQQEENEEIEAKEENYHHIKEITTNYFSVTQEYSIHHPNYEDILNFILDKTTQKVKGSIFYAENDIYLVCSYLVEHQNYFLCTDRNGKIKAHFLIQEETESPKELILDKTKILWVENNNLSILLT